MSECPKCGKPSWAPYTMKVVGKYGQLYQYQVYRHRITDGRKRKHGRKVTKCTVKIIGGAA